MTWLIAILNLDWTSEIYCSSLCDKGVAELSILQCSFEIWLSSHSAIVIWTIFAVFPMGHSTQMQERSFWLHVVCSMEKMFICDINHVLYQCSMLCQCMESKACFVSLGNRFSGPVQTSEMCAIASVRQLHPTLLKAPLYAFCSPFTCYYIQLCHLIESCYQSSCPDVTLNILSATSPEPDSAWVDI